MTHLNFSWTSSDQSTNAGIVFRLYETDPNGTSALAQDNIAALSFSLLMDGKPQGNYKFHATEFDTSTHLESAPSNEVAYSFLSPSAPTGFKISSIT